MKYFHIDTSPFGIKAKLCFDQAGADAILKDHDIDFAINAFDLGVAETHLISDGIEAIIIVIADVNKIDHDRNLAAGIAAHESVHVACRIFEHIGQPLHTVGEEIVAYTIEHLTKQIASAMETEINARKGNRKVSKRQSKRAGRQVVQVDLERDGSQRSDSISKRKGSSDRVKNPNWDDFFKAKTSVPTTSGSGISSNGAEE